MHKVNKFDYVPIYFKLTNFSPCPCSLIKEEEEPEQTPVETEGENGIFPL